MDWRICPSAVLFSAHDFAASETDGASFVHAADVDRDGDVDVLSASRNDGKIAWFENIDGNGNFGSQRIITSVAVGAESVFAADVDGDGDVDALSASASDGKIAWFENVGNIGGFGTENIITMEAAGAEAVFAADIDGDGDVDVLSASSFLGDDRIAWYENTDGAGTFGPQRVITREAAEAASVFAADVDGDGDVDVLSASSDDGKIAWYQNTNSDGHFGPQIVISTDASGAESVVATDIDGDGDIDVLSASSGGQKTDDRKVAWYENIDGNGRFGEQRVISTEMDEYRQVFAIDLDADGDVDVLSASFDDEEENEIAWHENIDGKGSFASQREITDGAFGASSVFAVDIDGDGDVDALSASAFDDKIAWYENTDGKGTFGSQMLISQAVPDPSSLIAADIDGDGDLDALSTTSYGVVAWYENRDKGRFGRQRVITAAPAYSANYLFAADVDGDGDLDVLSSFEEHSDNIDVAWYENSNGQGRNWREHVISKSGHSNSVPADIDGDGDLDVVSKSQHGLTWNANTDGAGTFGPDELIGETAPSSRIVAVADLDGDGDSDVLTARYSDGTIAWHENTDGEGAFGPQRAVSAAMAEVASVIAADVDGDDDLDLLSAFADGDKIVWYENTNGKGTFSTLKIISEMAARANVLFTADVDIDGDLDVLSATDRGIVLYANTDGRGTFGPGMVISERSMVADLFAADFDADGNVDIISASSGRITWHEQRPHVAAGDANGDSQFNQLDIVRVLQAAKYLTEEPATFDEGDWNCDGVFDQLDIVTALQSETYLSGPHASAASGGPISKRRGEDLQDLTAVDPFFEIV